MVNTRSSTVRATRSTTKNARKLSHYNHSPSLHKSKATVGKARGTKRDDATTTTTATPVGTPTASSATSAYNLRTRITTEPTMPSPRTRRGAMSVSEPSTPSSLVSPSQTRSTRKRKREEYGASTSRPKRRRDTSIVEDESDVHSIAERLRVDEQALHVRERELKKREAAVEKLKKKLMDKSGKTEKTIKRIRSEKLRVTAQVKTLQGEVKALNTTIATLEKGCRERSRDVVISPASSGGRVDTHWVLAQLEDQFQCSLCFEVMACPYQLNHGRCGHNFCALCLLQWSFSAVHRSCGFWHDALECPLCRAELPCTPDATPRQMCTLPFVPSRLADATIKMLLGILLDATEADHNGRGSCAGANANWDDRVIAWSRNGNARVEWEGREARGRAEMSMLVNNWTTLGGPEFVAFKDRLESQ